MSDENSEAQTPRNESEPEPFFSGDSGFLILGLITGLAIGHAEACGFGLQDASCLTTQQSCSTLVHRTTEVSAAGNFVQAV